MKAKGYVIYEGPSLLDGEPIVAIVTLKSANVKTGDMAQTWILRADEHPMDSLQSGRDASICGDCKHRPSLGGACYVNVGQAPSQVWKSYRAGKYPRVDAFTVAQHLIGRTVRLGAYGDPAAVPASIWRGLVSMAKGWTGYTHQWLLRSDLRDLCMASVDDEQEHAEAKMAGWRTFRVRTAYESLVEREIACPASDEGGNKTTCEKCKLCAGTATKAKDVAIVVHGAKAKRFITLRQVTA